MIILLYDVLLGQALSFGSRNSETRIKTCLLLTYLHIRNLYTTVCTRQLTWCLMPWLYLLWFLFLACAVRRPNRWPVSGTASPPVQALLLEWLERPSCRCVGQRRRSLMRPSRVNSTSRDLIGKWCLWGSESQPRTAQRQQQTISWSASPAQSPSQYPPSLTSSATVLLVQKLLMYPHVDRLPQRL